MKTNRIQVLMSDEELQALDAWRYANHIASRGEAIRKLVYAGVAATAPGVLWELAVDSKTRRSGAHTMEGNNG